MVRIYGIELSKETLDVSFRDPRGNNVHQIVKNNFKEIVRFLENLPKDVLLCGVHIEVYEELLVFLCNSMDVPIALASDHEIRNGLGLQKGKGDKLDAKRIREYGEKFKDKISLESYPSEEMKELNELFKLREELQEDIKMLLTNEENCGKIPLKSTKVKEITSELLERLSLALEKVEQEIKLLIKQNKEA